MSVETIAKRIQERVASSGFDRSVKVDLGSEGVILIDGTSVTTTDGDADCTITMQLDDFEALAAGELDPTSAFMQGKMRIDGDMTVAMALGQLL
jgi:putative sterol carrier protein